MGKEWSKAGDRDPNGYLNVIRNEVKGERTAHHQLGHVEKRKKNRVLDKRTMAEWGNWIADGIAGNARKQAEREELEWNVQVDAWNAKVDRREAAGGVTRPVVKPIRKRTAPLLPAWRLVSNMQWVLCWENLEVGGSRAHCIMGPRGPAEFLLHRLPAQAVGWTFPALLPGQRGL